MLGVSERASVEEIKRAFQQRAKITHPDVVKGKDGHFREMVEAYRVLRDPRKRAEPLVEGDRASRKGWRWVMAFYITYFR